MKIEQLTPKSFEQTSRRQRVLITGAAGNLGNLLAQHLKDNAAFELNLLIHKKGIAENLKDYPNVHAFKADLADRQSLDASLQGVDTIVHLV